MAKYCIYVWLFAYFALPLITLGDLAFRCPSCTAERAACPEVTPMCEFVRQLGCGCCPVCARQEGELCGVYTPRCSSGLRCYPRAEAEFPLQELLNGFGRCGQNVDVDIMSLDDLYTNGKTQLFWFLHCSPNDDNEVNHVFSLVFILTADSSTLSNSKQLLQQVDANKPARTKVQQLTGEVPAFLSAKLPHFYFLEHIHVRVFFFYRTKVWVKLHISLILIRDEWGYTGRTILMTCHGALFDHIDGKIKHLKPQLLIFSFEFPSTRYV